jgi:hypothetical protein
MDHSSQGRFKDCALFLALIVTILLLTISCQKPPITKAASMHWLDGSTINGKYYLVCDDSGQIIGEIVEYPHTWGFWIGNINDPTNLEEFDTEDKAGSALIDYAQHYQLCNQ